MPACAPVYRVDCDKSSALLAPCLAWSRTGDRAQVIEVTEAADPREQRIALSMKLVNQADGADLDPSNAEAETDVRIVTGASFDIC